MSEGRFVLTRIRQTLVVTLEGSADVGCLQAAWEALAQESVRESAKNVVFEVSGCEVIDLDEFLGLRKLVQSIEFLGLRCAVAGLRPGSVAYLASAGVSVGSLRTSLDLEHALFDLDADDTETDSEADMDDTNEEQDYEPNDAGRFDVSAGH
jgi:hypothetical protein